MRVVSWNVNGLRAALKKGFAEWLEADGADIVGLQEVRALPEQLPPAAREPTGRHAHWVAAERKGYSGVGLLSRREPDALVSGLGDPAMDAEGRFQLARFGRLQIVNAYFPNGSGRDRDNSRIPYKLEFYRRVFGLMERALHDDEAALVMGDFNTAHEEIDLARPKQNVATSGFRPEERAEITRWLEAGWVDTFRALHPTEARYSWWSQRRGVREKNIGWRIDYVLATPSAMRHVRKAFIDIDVLGSDHCPVGVELHPDVA
ncbi:MAG: exodeoxyribonuclease III [Planctomycetota bacterium]|jgi:exodeoxyribonuclease-3